METVSAGVDFTWVIVAAIIAVGIVAGAFALRLKQGGTPNKELPGQVLLKGEDLFDSARDKFVALMHDELDKLAQKVTLKDRYFDTDDFLGDIGRLPSSYTNTVTLTTLDGVESMKRPGSETVVRYYVQPGSGNVTKNKPA